MKLRMLLLLAFVASLCTAFRPGLKVFQNKKYSVLEERLASLLGERLEEEVSSVVQSYAAKCGRGKIWSRFRKQCVNRLRSAAEDSVAERLSPLLEERMGDLHCQTRKVCKAARCYCLDWDQYNKEKKEKKEAEEEAKRLDTPVLGAMGSNECDGKQMTWQRCKRYADETSQYTWDRKSTWEDYPKGCFRQTKNKRVYFNEHATGAGMANPPTNPICLPKSIGWDGTWNGGTDGNGGTYHNKYDPFKAWSAYGPDGKPTAEDSVAERLANLLEDLF